ncbi:uncharacterized protein C8A04DRAFT_14694 [Dichotomopilus funicola]|uniref:Uncharacterized protein n=1 Tax=Dichotomopilus funicola TaxID=1934379 RepID=A0AAN6UX05_9PEZI|nr:hypothetical protein C8A04DRAFT_14694 [Dichotomopilus funicola]
MKPTLLSLTTFISLLTPALANTEKTIFLGPERVRVPLTRPTLTDLRLHTLTPANSTLRTQLPAQFPSDEKPRGTETWLILDDLTPGQRYEVRVCWAATQPTEFTLTTYPLPTVLDTPSLITSLHNYSLSLQPPNTPPSPSPLPQTESTESTPSLLLLHILTTADFFTTDRHLMSKPPPVSVDIILDPFVFNLLPRSLVGTVGYVVMTAVVAVLVAGKVVVPFLRGVVHAGVVEQEGVGKKRE